jgi:hypothetical protein
VLQDDPSLPLNCSHCGTPLTYDSSAISEPTLTAPDLHFYRCPTHGAFYLSPTGLHRTPNARNTGPIDSSLRIIPSSKLGTTNSDAFDQPVVGNSWWTCRRTTWGRDGEGEPKVLISPSRTTASPSHRPTGA